MYWSSAVQAVPQPAPRTRRNEVELDGPCCQPIAREKLSGLTAVKVCSTVWFWSTRSNWKLGAPPLLRSPVVPTTSASYERYGSPNTE